MRILLLRHGESEGNASGVIQGHLDFGLTELGRRQAAATAGSLRDRGIDRVVSSPLSRAGQTAIAIGEAVALPVEFDERLAEYDPGEVSGLTSATLREKYPEIIAAWRRGERPAFPGEEGRQHFNDRVRSFVESYRGASETVLAVAHGGVISAICYQVLGMDERQLGAVNVDNCSITELGEDRAGRLVLIRQNDTCHLGQLDVPPHLVIEGR